MFLQLLQYHILGSLHELPLTLAGFLHMSPASVLLDMTIIHADAGMVWKWTLLNVLMIGSFLNGPADRISCLMRGEIS